MWSLPFKRVKRESQGRSEQRLHLYLRFGTAAHGCVAALTLSPLWGCRAHMLCSPGLDLRRCTKRSGWLPWASLVDSHGTGVVDIWSGHVIYM